MAISKGRSSKRAASSSYSSTVTTLVFVTLCIVGIWMLTSSNSSPAPSRKTASSSKARVDSESDPPPCLDNEKAIKQLHSRAHFEHRERHCPEEPPTCLVPLPQGYKPPVEWPSISAVMGSKRLPFPSRVFDLVHCARCRVPWHAEGGRLLLELNRVLRPGGYFVWSATPVYQKLKEDVEIWKKMSALTQAMCWKLVTIQKDKLNSVGAAIYQKPTTNDCYQKRKHNQPPMCKDDDDPNALQSCMHKVPVDDNERGAHWPEEWPRRLQTPPYWLNTSQMGIYGRPAPDDFTSDYEHWKRVVNK